MLTYKRKHVSMLLVCLILGLLGHRPLEAQNISNAPEITLNLAWDQYIRAPGWTEVQVTLNNEFGDWEGQLHIIDKNNEVTYYKHLVLPGHSKKQYRIPLFLKETFNIQIQLQHLDGNIAHQQPLTLRQVYDTRVCVIANMDGILPVHELNSCDHTLLIQDLRLLPETAMAWDTLDVLLINGLSTHELTIEQQNAMLAWVSAGGYLILSGGPALPQTLAHLPLALQIAELGKVETFSFPPEFEGLGQMHALPLIPNDEDDDVLLSISEMPLALAHNQGQGKIILVSWDIAQQASLLWLENFWIDAPIPATASPLVGKTPTSIAIPATHTLLEVPLKVLPIFSPGLLIFPIYLILMGPGTWFIVRRLQRPVLAWILLPIWITLMLVMMALGLSGVFSKTFPIVHEVAMIYVSGQGSPARVVQGTAIYAPRMQSLTWNTQHGAPRPLLGSYLFESWYGEGTTYTANVHYTDQLINIDVPHPFGIHTWGTEGIYTPPPLQSKLSIVTQQGIPYISGSLQSAQTLHDVSLLLGQGNYQLTLTDHLTAAHEIRVNEILTSTDHGSQWNYNVCRGLSAEMGYATTRLGPITTSKPPVNLKNQEPTHTLCYITGVIDEVPFPAQHIGGTHLQESCVIYTVPCPIQTEGTLKASLKGDPTQIENGWMEEEGVVYLGLPNTSILYVLPEFLSIRKIHKLTITVGPAPWLADESYILETEIQHIALWDWEQQEWIEQPMADFKPRLSLTGTNAERFFSQEKGLRLNIAPKTQDGVYISITPIIEGAW